MAFEAALAGVKAAEDIGLWQSVGEESPFLQLIAREGGEPPGVPRTKFAAFESLSVLQGRGAVFTARLASGTNRVDANNNQGCWAIASAGSLQLVFREGERINGKTLRSFILLGAVPGSHGQRRAWAAADPTPSLIYRAFYDDGSDAIVTAAVP